MDTLLSGGTLVTCDRENRVIAADLLVRGDRIAEIRPRGGSPGKRPGTAKDQASFVRVVDATGMAVMPGFIQAHVHLCQALFRGRADDLPLLDWLKQRIWPFEAAHDPSSLRASADLGLLEMMLAGTTTILDMGTVAHHEVVFQACDDSGIRAISGKTMMDAGDGVPVGLRESTKSSLRESERLCRRWHGAAGGRLGYAYAPRFILSCSEDLIRQAAALAGESGALIHTHVSEHASEREAVRRALGDTDIALLERWGVTGPKAILAHGVQLTDDEALGIARAGTRIVHCPSANLKLGSGIARVAELDRMGVRLALGADGAPCNNNLDPFVEMRHAALLAKIRTGVTDMPAQRTLRLATIDGAVALGLDGITGSIEIGKRADLALVRLDTPHAEPASDVLSKLVYACTARDVVHVFVDGKHLVDRGTHRALEREEVLSKARAQIKKLVQRADV